MIFILNKKLIIICILMALALVFAAGCGCVGGTISVAELLSLGEQFLLENKYEQALVQFLRVIEIEPMNPSGYIGAAQAYIGLDNIEAAIAILRQGLELLPGNAELEELLGTLLAPKIREAYMKFLHQRAFESYIYLSEQGSWWVYSFTEYAIIDIDGDGIPELIVNSRGSFEWSLALVFSYDIAQGNVVYVSTLYHWSSLLHSQQHSALVFSPFRRNHNLSIFTFYTPESMLGDSGYLGGGGTFSLSFDNGTFSIGPRVISEEEFQGYLNETKEIVFRDIPLFIEEVSEVAPEGEPRSGYVTPGNISDDWQTWFSIPFGEWFGDSTPEYMGIWWSGTPGYFHPIDSESILLFYASQIHPTVIVERTEYPIAIIISINKLLRQPSTSVEELRYLYGDSFSVEWCELERWRGWVLIDGFSKGFYLLGGENDNNITTGVMIFPRGE